jgi:hypothetical protein
MQLIAEFLLKPVEQVIIQKSNPDDSLKECGVEKVSEIIEFGMPKVKHPLNRQTPTPTH